MWNVAKNVYICRNKELYMDANKVDLFISSRVDYFPTEMLPVIRQQLLAAPESAWARISMLQFKSPMVALVLSIILGYLGIDRFYIGDVGLGIGKLLTCGGAGIWEIVDWFLIMNATRQKNVQTLGMMLNM